MKKLNRLCFSLIILIALIFFTNGCNPEGNSAVNYTAVKHLASDITDKSSAAEVLQDMIRKSGGLSVYHKGFKPKATPPCPAPEWTPQDILTVNEREIRTEYQVQHWFDERETSKSSMDLIGYETTFWRWSGRLGPKTTEEFKLRLADVRRVWVERGAFSKWVIFHVYYTSRDSDNDGQALEQVFKIWFERKSFNKKQESYFLANLVAVCPNIEK